MTGISHLSYVMKDNRQIRKIVTGWVKPGQMTYNLNPSYSRHTDHIMYDLQSTILRDIEKYILCSM